MFSLTLGLFVFQWKLVNLCSASCRPAKDPLSPKTETIHSQKAYVPHKLQVNEWYPANTVIHTKLLIILLYLNIYFSDATNCYRAKIIDSNESISTGSDSSDGFESHTHPIIRHCERLRRHNRQIRQNTVKQNWVLSFTLLPMEEL